FLGLWNARAYVAECPKGWYASAEGQQQGPEYTYRLPGCVSPTGPFTRERAESIARQMIGLAPDATVPPADRLVRYLAARPVGRSSLEAKDVTGRRWAPGTGNKPEPCSICGQLISDGWVQGRWIEAQHRVCSDHVEVHNEPRPADRR